MGLDISVKCTGGEVLEAIQCNDCGTKLPDVLKKLIEAIPNNLDDKTIRTRPGSYSGLHIVRAMFCEMKDLPVLSKDRGIPETHREFHLLNHSDCDGWYLPEDFDEPQWMGDMSVGSSIKLLKELEELYPLAVSSDWLWRWEALFIPAAASVATGTPIKFH